MNCFLLEDSIRRHLRPVETMAALVAAVCHDLDHPGKNEKFLIATRNPLTCMYGDSSVLENHHWRAAVALLRESGVMEAIETAGEGADFQVKGLLGFYLVHHIQIDHNLLKHTSSRHWS